MISVNEGVGTSVPEKLEKWVGGVGGGRVSIKGGLLKWGGVEKFKRGFTPGRTR